jgi:surfactin synthase thioesterase subunit
MCVPCLGSKGRQHISTEPDFVQEVSSTGFFNDCVFREVDGPQGALPSGRRDIAIIGTFQVTCHFSDVCGHPFCKGAVATIQGVKYR